MTIKAELFKDLLRANSQPKISFDRNFKTMRTSKIQTKINHINDFKNIYFARE